MSDARSLLRAKKAETEARINHPYAAYNASGQLRCTVCILNVKNNVAWNGHLGSKAHRTNVAKLKAKEEEAEKKRLGKRKETEAQNGHDSGDEGVKKRRVEGDEEAEDTLAGQKPSDSFPSDFFSDPNRALPPQADDEDDDEDEPPQPKTVPPKTEIEAAVDREWEEFQKSLLDTPAVTEKNMDVEMDKHDTWNRATVFAEAELVSEVPEGFPALPSQNQDSTVKEAEETPQLDEKALAEKKAADDRELIMDRLLEEERAQEEADGRVATLKARLEGLKKRKESVRMMKLKTS